MIIGNISIKVTLCDDEGVFFDQERTATGIYEENIDDFVREFMKVARKVRECRWDEIREKRLDTESKS